MQEKNAGEKCYRIKGVKISTDPLVLTKKDRTHQRHMDKIFFEYKNKYKQLKID